MLRSLLLFGCDSAAFTYSGTGILGLAGREFFPHVGATYVEFCVVTISDEQYDQLVGQSHQPKNLVEFFRESPLVGVELDLERSTDTGR